MRHVFYPALVARSGDQRVLHVPDFNISREIGPDDDPYVIAVQAATTASEPLRKLRAMPLPSPFTYFSELRPAPELLFAVPIITYRDYIRVGLVIDPMLLAQIDQAAGRCGMSRSAFLSKAAASALLEDKVEAA